MPEVPAEAFSNPFAPLEQESVDVRRSNLSNDDFRRLLMTPKAPVAGSTVSVSATVGPKNRRLSSTEKGDDEKKLKKKSFYTKLKKEEEERQAEWASKYRDRAKERRDDSNPDSLESLPSASSYKAVAPGIVDPSVVAERRQQAIVESKFLGGDIQHTHLVKGLDYVLLDKVRSEIESKQKDEQSILEKREREKEKETNISEVSDDIKFVSTMGKNIYRALFLSHPPVRNEVFSPGRMAYVFELDDEYEESDIPTVLIRSKADCPVQESTTLTTNDIVINKLTQILSYLRQGMRSGKKSRRKEKGFATDLIKSSAPGPKLPEADQNIFDDVGEYSFGTSSSLMASKRPQSYFDNDAREAKLKVSPASNAVSVKDRVDKKGNLPKSQPEVPLKKQEKFAGLEGHYAECYPGGMEDFGGNYDSDEDADFTKMDMGSKKGPVKRWDFESEDDYSSYQSKREALPKAAFQYGVKMSEGRKTRRYGGGAGGKAKEKAKLDREWQQISAILDKRKGGGGDSSSSAKRSKH